MPRADREPCRARRGIIEVREPDHDLTCPVDRTLEEGFSDTTSDAWLEKGDPPGVFLTSGQPSGYYSTMIEVRISEGAILPATFLGTAHGMSFMANAHVVHPEIELGLRRLTVRHRVISSADASCLNRPWAD
jgi:hypothetical protein